MLWEAQLCADTETNFAVAMILDDTPGNARRRWIKSYSSVDAMSWDMERLGIIQWSVAQVIRDGGLPHSLTSIPTYVANPKETLRSFDFYPLIELQ